MPFVLAVELTTIVLWVKEFLCKPYFFAFICIQLISLRLPQPQFRRNHSVDLRFGIMFSANKSSSFVVWSSILTNRLIRRLTYSPVSLCSTFVFDLLHASLISLIITTLFVIPLYFTVAYAPMILFFNLCVP